jgi:hypothetical protein
MKKEAALFVLAITELFVFLIFSLNYARGYVFINEVMPNPDSAYDEWLEIANPENISINLSEWKIGVSSLQNTSIRCVPDNFCSEITNLSYILVIAKKANVSAISPPNIFFNASNVSNYWFANSGRNIILYHFEEIIDLIDYPDFSNKKGQTYSRLLNNSWQNCTPTPGYENNCLNFVSNNTNNQSNQSNTIQNNTNQTNQTKEYLELDWDKDEILNNEEFKIEIKAFNLKDSNYDVKASIIEEDNILSEFYDSNENKWFSSNYYFDNFFSGSGNKEENIRLRLKERYNNFSGRAEILVKLRKDALVLYELSLSIRVLNSTHNSSKNNSLYIEKVIETSSLETLEKEAITLQADEKISNFKDLNNRIIYKSKNEYIKEYAFYSFSGLLPAILLIVLISLTKKLRAKREE